MAMQARLGRIESSQDARGRIRRKLFLEADVGVSDSYSAKATVHNISETGLLIETEMSLSVGDLIEVDLAQTGLKQAEVVWIDDRLFGCSFTKEISSATVSSALLRGSTGALSEISERVSKPDPATELAEDNRTAPEVKLSPSSKLLVIVGLAILSWAFVGTFFVWLLTQSPFAQG